MSSVGSDGEGDHIDLDEVRSLDGSEHLSDLEMYDTSPVPRDIEGDHFNAFPRENFSIRRDPREHSAFSNQSGNGLSSSPAPPAAPKKRVRAIVESEDEEPAPHASIAPSRSRSRSVSRVVETPQPALRDIRPVKSAALKQPSQAKHWSITHFDFPQEWLQLDVAAFKATAATFYEEKFGDANLPTSFVCVGKEQCPESGRWHMQMYASFVNKCRKTALIKVFPTMSFYGSKGTPKQNYDYCSGLCAKKGNVINAYFSECGEMPATAADSSRDTWRDVVANARAGNLEVIADEQPRIFLTQLKNLEHVSKNYRTGAAAFVNPHDHVGLWIFSKASGRGKTSLVWASFPALYEKARDLLWNEYAGQEIALLDDFAKTDSNSMASHLKNWTHHAGFRARVLYGTAQVHVKLLIITSNFSMEECFSNMGPETYDALRNRFRVICLDDDKDVKTRPLLTVDGVRTLPFGGNGVDAKYYVD